MIENFRELDLTFFAITETWLKNDERMKKEIADMANGENIALLTRNRGSRGGGTALAYDSTRASFRIENVPHNKFEILFCAGSMTKLNRKIVVAVIYIPPKKTISEVGELNDFLADALETLHLKYNDPLFVIAGDLNKKELEPALADFPEIKKIITPPTRGTSTLDLVYTNCDCDARVLPPLLCNDESGASDHSVVFLATSFPLHHEFKKRVITFRPYTQRGEEMFGQLLLGTDWSHLEAAEEPADLLRERLDCYVDMCFPKKKRTFKSTDKPWLTKKIQLLTRRKKREYKRNGKSMRWKRMEDEVERDLLESRVSFFDRVKSRLVKSGNSREYFRAVAALASGDQGIDDKWSLSDMFPGKSDGEVAEEVATFFNRISSEYTPLSEDVAPVDCGFLCPELHEISAKLKFIRKPKSQVAGDIPPKLVTKYSDLLAIPLRTIFERSFTKASWPKLWKKESVTVIPKCTRPSSLSELRNLSCTPLFSKVMETFLLKRLKDQTELETTQFGGIRGSSVDHFLIETWDNILRSLEDNRAAVSLVSIDFEKAFNRVCHHQCLAAARKMGADEATVAMLRAFLTGRTMSVRVNSTFSTPKLVCGGSPQGSILGNYLFCMITNQLNDCLRETNAIHNLPRLNLSVDFEENGNDTTDNSENEDAAHAMSPISRPVANDLSFGTSSEEDEILASNFICFRPFNRINDTELTHIADQEEIDRIMGPTPGWHDHQLHIEVYIDDLNSIEKIKQVNSVSTISEGRRIIKVHSPRTETFFEQVSTKADELKMRVNQKKTQMLCITANSSDVVVSYMRPRVAGVVEETVSTDSLKILGFHFDRSPTVNCHVSMLCKKFRVKLWSVRVLKKAGIGPADMLNIYKCTVRPIIEFAAATYGPMLTQEQKKMIERLQLRVMKIIYGLTVSYRTVLEATGLQTLEERRCEIVRKFAEKTSNNERFREKWFPKNHDTNHLTRFPKVYREENCRTNRLYNSPIYTMRRILNNQ